MSGMLIRTGIVTLATLLLTLVDSAPVQAQSGTQEVPRAFEGQDARDLLVVRFACLQGGREAGSAPTSSGVLGRQELVEFLLDWKPGVDNDEMREIFALNDLGELVRHARLLHRNGGTVSGSFTRADSEFEIILELTPAQRGSWMGTPGSPFRVDVGSEYRVSAEIRRDSLPFLGPTRIHYSPDERAIITFSSGSTAPFLFLVLDLSSYSSQRFQARSAKSFETSKYFLVDGESVSEPIPIDPISPRYTDEARAARYEGTVVVQTVIDADGNVESVELLDGQPYGLSEAALSAVRSWRFQPAIRSGVPVAAVYLLSVDFRLD